jgi:hypothetical protein
VYQYVGARSILGLGAEEKRNPLPPGSYWIDVFGDNRQKMATWMQTNGSAINSSSTEEAPGDTPATSRVTYTFSTTAATPWDAVTFGYPEIIVPDPTLPVTPGQAPPLAPAPGPPTAKPPVTSSNTTLMLVASVVLVAAIVIAVRHKKRQAA